MNINYQNTIMNVIQKFIINNLALFETISFTFLVLTIVYSIFTPYKKSDLNKLNYNIIYLILVCITLFSSRIYTFLTDVEFNVDESQYMVSALTIKEKSIFWKYLDITTAGPLNIYFLLSINWLGFDLTYISTRILGCCILSLSIISFFYTLKNFYNEYISRIGILSVLLGFYRTCTSTYLTHYSSEYVSVLLINLAVLGISIIWKGRRFKGIVFLTGLALGSLAFSKLQSVPIGLALAITCIVLFIKQKQSLSTYVAFIIGGLTIPIYFATYIMYYDIFPEFYNFYILSNIEYSVNNAFILKGIQKYIYWFLHLFLYPQNFLIIPFCLMSLICFILKIFFTDQKYKSDAIIALLSYTYLISSLYAMIKPGTLFLHYLMFLPFPLCFFSLYIMNRYKSLHNIEKLLKKQKTTGKITNKIVISLIGVVGIFCLSYYNPYEKVKLAHLTFNNPKINEVAQFIEKHLGDSKEIVIWGYAPSIYLRSETIMGTPHPHNYNIIVRDKSKGVGKYYYENFIEHLKKRKPILFIDLYEEEGFMPSKATSHYKELSEILEKEYKLIGQFNEDKYKIYKLMD